MLETWRISRSKCACGECGAEFSDRQPFFSALREEGEDLARLDFCTRCWEGRPRPEYFCHWKTRRASPEQKQVLDTGLMLEFFDRLEGAEAEPKKVFRFVIALYLMRRKELKLVGAERTGERERLVLEARSSGARTEVENPSLNQQQLEQAAAQLSSLLNADL